MSYPGILRLIPLLACAAIGCGQNIGDACETSLDCSSQGSRLCDRTQPNGYCTIRGCEQGTCPDDSVCVKFRPAQERLAVTYCMYECSEDDDCRDDESYRCAHASEFSNAKGEAEILGSASQGFCVATPRTPVDPGAPMMSMPEPGEGTDSGAQRDASSGLDAASGEPDAASSDATSSDAASNEPDGG